MIERVFVTDSAAGYDYTREIVARTGLAPERIPDERWYREQVAVQYEDPLTAGKRHLLLDAASGSWFRKCPGTRGKVCCNYYVIDQTVNCPFDCSYCFLQSYLNHPALRVSVNIDDLFDELAPVFSRAEGLRVGTGEVADSLALEPITGFAEKLVTFTKPYAGVTLELKTKSDHVADLPDVRDAAARFVVGWTLAPESVVHREELDVAPLSARLAAAQSVVERGYEVAVHLDPVVWYEGFEDDYLALVDRIFSVHDRLAWLSIAGFRYEPGLKAVSQRRFPGTRLFTGEFIRCSDGKFRYPFPGRVRFFRRLIRHIKSRSADTPVYFCMEDARTWRLAMGDDAWREPKLTPLFCRVGGVDDQSNL